jgi:hypothetical protein
MSACSAGERASLVIVEVSSNPKGASFRLNGLPVEAGKISLLPASNIIEASLIGHGTAHRIVEVDLIYRGPDKVVIDLKQLPDIEAWEDLRDRLCELSFDLTDAGLIALMKRFDIGDVIFLDYAKASDGFDALVGAPGKKRLEPLPGIGLPGEPLTIEFVDGLKGALGIAPPPEQATAPTQKVVIDDEPEEDDESSPIRLHPENIEDSETDTEGLRKVVTSPWFWVSVGVVAVVVTGVVIATQVD